MVASEDGNRIQTPKSYMFYIKPGRWVMAKNTIIGQVTSSNYAQKESLNGTITGLQLLLISSEAS
jgi:hypothetical protein